MDMLDHIIVSVDELFDQVNQLKKDGFELVELSILPPDTLDGETMPASLNLAGLMPDDPTCTVDYDPIDAADV